MLYTAARVLLFPLVKLFFRLEVRGAENIPQAGKVILCSNHRSVFDPIFLAVNCKRRIRYMAKSEFFEFHGPFVRRLFYALGAFPVVRNTGDADSVKTAAAILRSGGVLGIFPQGGCMPGNIPFRPKSGVAFIARKAEAPILPACIFCKGKIRPFRKVIVRFGSLLPYEALGLDAGGREAVKAAAQKIAQHVNFLLEEKN